MASKPKAPKPSKAEKEAERRAQDDLAAQELRAQEEERQRMFGRRGLFGSVFTSARGRAGLTTAQGAIEGSMSKKLGVG